MKRTLTSIFVFAISCSLFAQVENRTTTTEAEKKLVNTINLEKYVEFAPSISADGRTMIFESDRNKGWKLFETKLNENGNWSEPASVSGVNDFGRKNDFIAGPNISYDGNSLYFFGFFMFLSESEDIFVSTRTSEGWSEPQPLPAPVNTEVYEGFPSIGSDGNTMYFQRVNEANPVYLDSLGEPVYTSSGEEMRCFEIWKTVKNKEGAWSDPQKLPPPINTGCESSPKIMADGETLLFSSAREGGKGLFDLYQSTLKSDGTWGEPIALDYVNTADDDLSPCISASGDLMYYYSNNDIYEVAIPPKYRQQKNITVEGYITRQADSQAMPTRVIIEDNGSGELLGEIENSATDGWYSIVLTKGRDYRLKFATEGYIPETHTFNLIGLEEYREEHLNIALTDKIALRSNILDEELLDPVAANVTVRVLSDESTSTFANVTSFENSLQYGNTYLVSVGANNFELLVDTINTLEVQNVALDRDFKMKPKKVKFQMDVVDLSNNTKVKSKLKFKNKNRTETIEANSDEFVSLRSGDRYEVESTSEGYFFGSTEIVVDELVAGPDGIFRTKEPIAVARIEVNASLVLKGIRFDTGSYTLTEDSQNELVRIVQMMQKNPNVVIEISAHTDDVGDPAYNLRLSEQRAQSVVQYLTTHSIDVKNLVPVGYGMNRPAVPNDSDENRAKNRRVEMSVLRIE